MKPKIGILTIAHNFDPAYSLNSIIQAQLLALVKHGYKPALFVLTIFDKEDEKKIPEGVEVRKIIPQLLLVDYSGNQPVTPDFEQNVEKVLQAFREHFKDIDIMLTHDVIFQGWFLPYCAAVHKIAQELPNLKWFHWIHSAPSGVHPNLDYPHSLRYSLPANSKLIQLNNEHLIRAAETYGIWPKDVRVIYNPIDPRQFWNLNPFAQSLIDKYDLLLADFLDVYPLSTPRMGPDGKQLDIVIMIMGALKRLGRSVRLIVANAHANAEQHKKQIAEMLLFANQQGLSNNEVIFTSREGQEYELGISRESVAQLFQLSNLFIFPSRSENGPLILYEAMLSKCILVLNKQCPGLQEFGRGNALYFNFGSLLENTNFADKDGFMEDVAKIIISEYENNRVLKAFDCVKKTHNYDVIFKRMVEPLFSEK